MINNLICIYLYFSYLFLIARAETLNSQEEEESRAQFNKNKQYAAFQLRQAELKARRKAQAKIEELQEVAQIQLSIKEQEDVFRQYADEWLQEYRRQGKTTGPLELNLNRKATFSMGTMS